MKTATITAKIEPELKQNVELILNELGLSDSELINLLYRQVYMLKAIPFELKVTERTKKKK